jgi:hypothetical protein
MYKYLIGFLFTSVLSIAQTSVLSPDYIKSVQLTASEGNTFVPIISKQGFVTLSFDDLEGDEKDYYYLLEHCDKSWNTSDLLPTEYIQGYEKDRIRHYENSFNTLQYYTHYKITFPNEDTRMLLSGNYRISILNDYDEVMFTRHFMVYEPVTTVGVSVHRSREVAYLGAQQSVQFSVYHPGLTIQNPRDEIYPVIYQNFDFTSRNAGLKPQFMRRDQLLYKYDAETAYWAGNEYLYFDNKDMLTTSMTVAAVRSGDVLYDTYLFPDSLRAFDPYTYYPDANGAFVIRNIKGDDSGTEADYSWVHFSMTMTEMLDKNVYVYGGFNNFQLTDENRMMFNPDSGRYEAKILLKQGFYNYTYVTLSDENELNLGELNGNFEETENEYQVLIYYSKFGSKYDRLIGYGIGISRELQQ